MLTVNIFSVTEFIILIESDLHAAIILNSLLKSYLHKISDSFIANFIFNQIVHSFHKCLSLTMVQSVYLTLRIYRGIRKTTLQCQPIPS